jgi:hypothetical protein
MILSFASQISAAETEFSDFLRKNRQAYENWTRGGEIDALPVRHPEATKRQTDNQISTNTVAYFSKTGSDSLPLTKKVTYLGQADYDGCSAMLELNFNNNHVSGNLIKKGQESSNIRLTTTKLSFESVPLTGSWESEGTSISAKWVGGDFMGGKLLTTPDYPTNGTLYIRRKERDGKQVICLDRIGLSSSFGYTFNAKGKVFTPVDSVASDEPASTGYHDPVGKWRGSADIYMLDQLVAYQVNVEFLKNGHFSVTSVANGNKEDVTGKWKREGDGINVETTDEDGDVDRALLKFGGRDCILYRDQVADIRLYRQGTDAGTAPDSGTTSIPSYELSDISGIELSKSIMTVVPGTNYPLPEIIGILRSTKERVPLVGATIRWSPTLNLIPRKGMLHVEAKAEPKTEARLTVEAKLDGRILNATLTVKIVKELKTGSVYGRVRLYYLPGVPVPPGLEYPLGALLQLTGPEGIQRCFADKSGYYRFDSLIRGRYMLRVERAELPAMPAGYFSLPQQSDVKVFDLPKERVGGEEWIYNAGLENPLGMLCWQIDKLPDTSYCIYGKVTYKTRPIDRVTVRISNQDGSSSTNVATDVSGYYSIDTRQLNGGKYWVSAVKMVGSDPRWATDDDLMNPGSARPEAYPPLTVSLPVSATGKEINIKCLTRRELFNR